GRVARLHVERAEGLEPRILALEGGAQVARNRVGPCQIELDRVDGRGSAEGAARTEQGVRRERQAQAANRLFLAWTLCAADTDGRHAGASAPPLPFWTSGHAAGHVQRSLATSRAVDVHRHGRIEWHLDLDGAVVEDA